MSFNKFFFYDLKVLITFKAIGVVSEFLEEEEYDKLEGLVSPECIAGLKKNLTGLTQEEKRYLRINPEDIFFSFIPVFRSNEAGQTVTLGDYLSNPQNCISLSLQLIFLGKK